MPSVPISQKVTACSAFATFHQPFQRLRFSSSCGKVLPVAGTASSSPVSGDTMCGM
jgi:hypothetical protein